MKVWDTFTDNKGGQWCHSKKEGLAVSAGKEIPGIFLTYIIIILPMGILAGCASKPSEIITNEIPSTPPSTTVQLKPDVPPAPMQVYLRVGHSEQFTYWNHNITINYKSASPKQLATITVDGEEKDIEVELTADPRGIYWRNGNLSFALKPVVWEIRDGQRIPFYEKTWNTSELYFEVVAKISPSVDTEKSLELYR